MQTLNEATTCPTCNQYPKITTNPINGLITLECEKDGGMAMGATLDMAKTHWNILVSFLSKAA